MTTLLDHLASRTTVRLSINASPRHCKLNQARSRSDVTRDLNLSALRFRTRGLPGLPGDLASAAAAAHAFDVGDKRDLRYLAGRFDRDRRCALQHGQHDPRF